VALGFVAVFVATPVGARSSRSLRVITLRIRWSRGVTGRVAPRRRRLRAPSAQRLRFAHTRVMHSFHTAVGSDFWTPPQPDRAPARESELPGEFVSEDLRADCARFLEDLWARIGVRADLPPGSTGSVPGPVE